MKKIENIEFEIPLDEETLDSLISLKALFHEMYGHNVDKNEETPYVFWNIYNDQKPYSIKIINFLRKAGVSEDYVYAYYKTGRIVTKNNKKYLTKEDLKEFNYFCKEYNKLIKAEPKNNRCNIIQFISFANDYLKKVFIEKYSYLSSALHDYLKRHLEESQDFLNYKITNEIDFLGFCCIKSLKDLESIKELIEMQMVENIYAICRSLFEAYIQVENLAHNNDFFNELLKNASNCTYDFKVKQDGSINYNELIIKKSKTKNVSIKKICDNSRYVTDKGLYDIFYRSTCQFIHLDVMSAKSYFHGFDPFQEIDASLIAAIVSITFLTLMLEQFSNVEKLKPGYKKDIKYLTNNIKKDLLLAFQVINTNEYNKNELFNSIVNRLQEKTN